MIVNHEWSLSDVRFPTLFWHRYFRRQSPIYYLCDIIMQPGMSDPDKIVYYSSIAMTIKKDTGLSQELMPSLSVFA